MPPQPPVYNATDFATQFQRLLPRGRVWHRGWGQVQDADILALMPAWARLHLRLNALINEIFPCTTVELIPEWEESLGLPDPCTGQLATLQQRTAAICAKFVARGGASREYFIHLAASLGFQIEIQEFRPFEASISHAGDPLYDEAWAYTWKVVVLGETTITWFRASVSTAGEPLRDWGNGLLECEFAKYKPAHTIIIWAYQLAESPWDDSDSIWDAGDSVWDEGAIGDVVTD